MMTISNQSPTNLSHANCADVLGAMCDAVTVQDLDFRIIYQNTVMKQFFGDCFGSICHTVYEESPQVCSDCPVSACFADGSAHSVEPTFHINGEVRFFENTAAPIKDEN